jgi:hypothetical protein
MHSAIDHAFAVDCQRELRVAERRHKGVGLVGELLELTPELVEFWRERKVRRCGHERFYQVAPLETAV